MNWIFSQFETNWIFNTYGLACVFCKIEHLSNIDEILTSGSLFVGIPQDTGSSIIARVLPNARSNLERRSRMLLEILVVPTSHMCSGGSVLLSIDLADAQSM